MNTLQNLGFKHIWLADFEFGSGPGERPVPVCMVAFDLITGQEIRLWREELLSLTASPYDVGPDSLFVAYYSSAELGCHLALNWPLPVNVLDLYSEFRCQTNGLALPNGRGLVGAMIYFGLNCMAAAEKDAMRDLVLRGGPWTPDEQQQILEYCASDVSALGKLLHAMLPKIDLPRALLRGRYMKAVSHMEHTGVPIDVEALEALRLHWEDIQEILIQRIDMNYGVFDGRTFKYDRWEAFVVRHGIPWPRLDSGRLELTEDTFREMARAHPIVAPIRELRVALSQMRLSDLAVGSDGRNRCMLSPLRVRPGGISPPTVNISSGRPRGCGGLFVPWRAWALPISIGSSRSLESLPPCRGIR